MWLSMVVCIVTLGFFLVPDPSHAQAGAKMPRIGILTYAFEPYAGFEAFHRGLRDLGYVEEGASISIKEIQPTPYSLRSSLASAFRRG